MSDVVGLGGAAWERPTGTRARPQGPGVPEKSWRVGALSWACRKMR